MTTIEPRLMNILNNPDASPAAENDDSYYASFELAPLQPLMPFSSHLEARVSNYSLPPLEPVTGASSSQLDKPPLPKKGLRHIHSLASIREEYNVGSRFAPRGQEGSPIADRLVRQPHSMSNMSLRKIFDHPNPEYSDPSPAMNHMLDDVRETSSASISNDVSNKKRHRAMTVKDDIMHLPQPLKKQKSTQNMRSNQNIMPPIINGLYEPPPNAAVFPPIAFENDGGSEAVVPSASTDSFPSSGYHTLRGVASCSALPVMTNFDTSPDMAEKPYYSPSRRGSLAPTPEAEKPMARIKRKAAKPRKKWSEEETKDLLLGVNRHGVGKWTSILEDPLYKFNGRTAGDLKDRFRTCCPDELRVVPIKSKESLNSLHDKSLTSPVEQPPKLRHRKPMMLENVLADPDDVPGGYAHGGYYGAGRDEGEPSFASSPAAQSHNDSDSTAAKPKKSRAHRKKIEDLQAMGIHGPFKKSHRRERRPFTKQDDDQILEGLQIYGPAWTKIQRDPRFDLSSRQPTDLRDRVRNKYPDMYKQIEERQAHNREPSSAGLPVSRSHPPLPTRQGPPRKDNVPPTRSDNVSPTRRDSVLPPRRDNVSAPRRDNVSMARRDNVLEPSVSNMIYDNGMRTLDPHLRRSVSREDMMLPKWAGPSASAPSATHTHTSHTSHTHTPMGVGGGFHELPGIMESSREPFDSEVGDGAEQNGPYSRGYEMDISRLLLD